VDPGDVLGLEHLGSMIKPRLRGWLHAGTFPLAVAVGAVLTALPGFWRAGGASVVACLVLGGALYTFGAVVYGLRRPDPNPRWFGLHEVFHH
jgi:channel protein (hemolysin III family)